MEGKDRGIIIMMATQQHSERHAMDVKVSASHNPAYLLRGKD